MKTLVEFCDKADESAVAAEMVMRALPQWFELEAPLRDLIETARTSPTFIAKNDSGVVGFLTVERRTPQAAEITAMGVLPRWHRHGIGRNLVAEASGFALSQGLRLLQVKTLGPSRPDEYYARTRAFYEALGFIPLEETTAFWGQTNPCLIMVRTLS
jgi:N-acetylglutamate synthase-like GNAT family acetyltransferase